jgi:hypothetical protein
VDSTGVLLQKQGIPCNPAKPEPLLIVLTCPDADWQSQASTVDPKTRLDRYGHCPIKTKNLMDGGAGEAAGNITL